MSQIRRRRSPPSEADEGARVDTDRILLTLVTQTQQLNERVSHLEEEMARDRAHELDDSDLLEIRLHSAKLSAELRRVTVSLRAEMDRLARRAGAGELDPDRDPPTGIDGTGPDGVVDLRGVSRHPSEPQEPSGRWVPDEPA